MSKAIRYALLMLCIRSCGLKKQLVTLSEKKKYNKNLYDLVFLLIVRQSDIHFISESKQKQKRNKKNKQKEPTAADPIKVQPSIWNSDFYNFE